MCTVFEIRFPCNLYFLFSLAIRCTQHCISITTHTSKTYEYSLPNNKPNEHLKSDHSQYVIPYMEKRTCCVKETCTYLKF